MCGIVGIFSTQDASPIDQALLKRMNDAQHHRGPDQEGFHVEPGVALGHRRLSIIDVSSGGQPIYNEDKSVVVIYNGEIYNFQELFAELTARGHVFRTHCDTEAIVHAWEEWGEQSVERFRGMFAFVIWDRNKRTLFAARDPMGIKPLHYALLKNGHFIFGSELKTLLLHPELDHTLDPRAIEDYFAYGYIPDPKSILASVKKLPAAHTLCIKRGEPFPSPKKYWDIPFARREVQSEESEAEELMRVLSDSVKSHLMTEVPLGAFLSGGVDSSAVVSIMAKSVSTPVTTCSIAFREPEFDESRYARIVADRYKTDHFFETVSSDEFSLLDKLAGLYDEPFADSSALPTYRLCQLARTRVTVALSGDGGDEDFAGYRAYRVQMNTERVRSLLPLMLRRPLFGALGALYPKADWAPRFLRAKRTFEALALDTVDSFARGAMITTPSERSALLSSSFRRSLNGYNAIEVMREHAARAPSKHPLSLIQYLDMKVYLCSDILTKVDRASMAHSLEVRVPLLDHKVVEWASGLPPGLQFRNGAGKYLFKKALRHNLPDSILYRPKTGFSIPLAKWFRGPLRERVRNAVLHSGLDQLDLFNRRRLERVVDEHERGLRDHSSLLWALLSFEAFQRKYLPTAR